MHLVWYRNDLRTIDCEPLEQACSSDEAVAACFLLAPGQWKAHGLGPNRIEYLRRTLVDLGGRLAELGIGFHLREIDTYGEAPERILEIARELGCETVHWGREYEVDELDRDRAARRLLETAGLTVHEHDDQVVIEPGTLKTGSGSAYKVFTPYRKSWERALHERGERTHRSRPRPRSKPNAGIGTDVVPETIPGFEAFVPIDDWPVGEVAALEVLDGFLQDRLGRYHEDRDTPSLPGTSRLGPALAVGALSPRTCVDAARLHASRHPGCGEGAAIWISELTWRDFYRNVLFEFPRVCRNRAFKPETEAVEWRDDEDSYAAWCEGRTGYPIVDAAMRCLVATGWMHNRLRMVTSQFLTKHLLIDWRRGEAFFAHHLVDYDFASNNGGWQWSASTGTDAAPYFRVFNPTTQGRRFDPDGTFIRTWVPELAELDGRRIHEPPVGGDLWDGPGYPPPIVDQSIGRKRAIEAFARLRDT